MLFAKDKNAAKKAEVKIRGGISVKEKIIFAKHLAVMIHSGLPLKDALEEIANGTKIKKFKTVLGIIVHEVENGQFLSSALGKYPKIFDELFTSLVRVGEESGRLSENLEYLALQLERSDTLMKKIRGALIYPAIILIGVIAVVGFLTLVTLPQLMPIFTSLKVTLPPTTQFLFDFSHFMQKNGLYLALGLVALVIGFRSLLLVKKFRFVVHRAMLSIPVFGGLLRYAQLTRFSQILGTLLTSGVDVVRALQITASSMGNLVYREELEAIAKNMTKQGESIAEYLERKPVLFPSITERMIRIGEKTGKLDESLMYVAEFYGKEIDNTVANMTSIIEPALLLIMGVVVGFVAISVITPIYKITEGIHK
jgi:type IV pilus assembly protein PilC